MYGDIMEYRQLIKECTDLYEDMEHTFILGEKEYKIRSPYMPKNIFMAIIKSAILDAQNDDGEIWDAYDVLEHLVNRFDDIFRFINFDDGYIVTFNQRDDPTECKIFDKKIKIRSQKNE